MDGYRLAIARSLLTARPALHSFPLKTGPRSEACSVPSAVLKPEFEYALTMYLAHVLHPDNLVSADERGMLGSLGSCKKGLVHELSRYDFSGARARLVMSIPFHVGTGAAMLSRLMPPRKETAHLPVVMQASSIGSQGPGRNYVTSYLANAMGQPDDSSERGLVNILWPSVGPAGFYGEFGSSDVGTMSYPSAGRSGSRRAGTFRATRLPPSTSRGSIRRRTSRAIAHTTRTTPARSGGAS